MAARTTGVKVGRVRLDQIRFHPHNIRRNLGDLRGLRDSITRFGVMQPVILEHHAGGLRLRAGHRRVAAARLEGLTHIPAVIHPEPLDDRWFLVHAVQENVMRRQLDHADRRRTVQALRSLGCSWTGIAEAFGVSAQTVASWGRDEPRANRAGAVRSRAVKRLVGAHRDEFDQLVREEREQQAAATPTVEDQAGRRAYVVAELEQLLGTDSEASIARRLGYRDSSSLSRALQRWGRSDLARRFARAEAA